MFDLLRRVTTDLLVLSFLLTAGVGAVAWAQGGGGLSPSSSISEWMPLITVCLSTLTTLLLAWMKIGQNQAAEKQDAQVVEQQKATKKVDEAAAKVEQVRSDLKESGQAVGTQLNQIHTAVNSERSAMQAELKRMNEQMQAQAEKHASELKALQERVELLATAKAKLEGEGDQVRRGAGGRDVSPTPKGP